jgi:hypothetical protein
MKDGGARRCGFREQEKQTAAKIRGGLKFVDQALAR